MPKGIYDRHSKKPKEVKDSELGLSEVKDRLEEEIRNKKIELENLTNKCHDQSVRLESDRKIEEVQSMNLINRRKEEISKREAGIDSQVQQLEIKKEEISRREKDVDVREKIMLDLEIKEKELNEKRGRFLLYKSNIEHQLEDAKQVINEASYKDKEIQQKMSDLNTAEKRISAMKEQADRERFQLEEDRRAFQIEKDNFFAQISEEVAHGN